jgi:hypothetical protein
MENGDGNGVANNSILTTDSTSTLLQLTMNHLTSYFYPLTSYFLYLAYNIFLVSLHPISARVFAEKCDESICIGPNRKIRQNLTRGLLYR